MKARIVIASLLLSIIYSLPLKYSSKEYISIFMQLPERKWYLVEEHSTGIVYARSIIKGVDTLISATPITFQITCTERNSVQNVETNF